jgi:hypothetical protein
MRRVINRAMVGLFTYHDVIIFALSAFGIRPNYDAPKLFGLS